MLNILWLAFFILGSLSAGIQWLWFGDAAVLSRMVNSLFDMAKVSVDIMLVLFGTLTLWLGLLRIAERAGAVATLSRWLSPLFARLMPGVPRGHPALGLITLNYAANGLGLDNAATPVGLRAMRELQSLNPDPQTATNAQILFLVLNTSSLTILPVTIFMYRLQQGAADPAMVFLPILLATSASTLAGFLAVAWMQRLRLHDPVVLLWTGAAALFISGLIAMAMTLSAATLSHLSTVSGNFALLACIVLFLVLGAIRKVPVYEAFVEGAKE